MTGRIRWVREWAKRLRLGTVPTPQASHTPGAHTLQRAEKKGRMNLGNLIAGLLIAIIAIIAICAGLGWYSRR